jgi:hypothetical protein
VTCSILLLTTMLTPYMLVKQIFIIVYQGLNWIAIERHMAELMLAMDKLWAMLGGEAIMGMGRMVMG